MCEPGRSSGYTIPTLQWLHNMGPPDIDSGRPRFPGAQSLGGSKIKLLTLQKDFCAARGSHSPGFVPPSKAGTWLVPRVLHSTLNWSLLPNIGHINFFQTLK